MLKKADIYQYYDQNGTKLSLIHKIALLTEKNKKKQSNKLESAVQLKGNKLEKIQRTTQLLQCFNIKHQSATQLPQLRRLQKLRFGLPVAICQSWAFEKQIIKRKRKFCNQNFSSLKRKRKFRNQKFLSSKRKRKFRYQHFLRLKRKRKFRNQNF